MLGKFASMHLLYHSWLQEHGFGQVLVIDAESRVDLLKHIAMSREQLHRAGVRISWLASLGHRRQAVVVY